MVFKKSFRCPITSLAIYLMSIVNINSLAFHGIGPLPCPENHVLLSYSARSYRGHRNGSYCIIFSLLVLLLSLFIENFKNFILTVYCSKDGIFQIKLWYFSDWVFFRLVPLKFSSKQFFHVNITSIVLVVDEKIRFFSKTKVEICCIKRY